MKNKTLLFIAVAIGCLLAGGGKAYAQTPNCMQDKVTFGLQCTANDVRIASYELIGGAQACVEGEMITVSLRAHVECGAQERYDIGLFVATDGGNALTGQCWQDYLPPPLQPTPPGCTGGAPLGTSPPYYNAECTEDPADTCGDLIQGSLKDRDLITLTIPCSDSNDDNIADVGSCVSWDNQASAGSANKPSCTNKDQTLPGTPSKCRCESVPVSNLTVRGAYKVTKVTIPSPDPTNPDTAFGFTQTPGTPATFGLTNGQTYSSGPVLQGTYHVAEGAQTTPWAFRTATCSDPTGNSSCTGAACTIVVNDQETVSCTYTNEYLCTTGPGGNCTTSNECEQAQCVDSNGNGVLDTCSITPKPATTICRPSAGQCDVAESCTGNSPDCPADGFAPVSTTCIGESNGGLCDSVTDSCDGAGNCADSYKGGETVCGPANQCEVAAACSGSSGDCPPNGFLPATTTCVGTSNGGACDGTDSCNGHGACVDGFLAATTICRADAGQCDVAESCTGTSGACPANGFQAATTTCVGTSNGGACDGADSCSGTANTCVDGFLTATTTCRASAGQCDVAESCTGTSGACPANAFQTATTACVGTSNSGLCDGTDSCDGAGACVDGFLTATTTCRASAGQCDVAESCTGSSGACPADGFQPSTTPCVGTSNGGVCDGTDSCSGTANRCVDGYLPQTTICRTSAGVCDAAESCTGSSGACPGDGKVPATTTCRPKANGCDVAESCDGTHNACPADTGGVLCASGLTNTEFCQIPNNTFNLTFLQDIITNPDGTLNKSNYMLNSSQPGQFYYNAFLTAPNFGAGDPVDLYINVPYPFVTQGAVPIQLHDGVGFTGGNCFVPSPSIQGCTIDTLGGNVSTSGAQIITIGDYDPQNVGDGTTTVHVYGCNVPPSGILYVTVHLDFGVKKTTGWTKGTETLPSANHAEFALGDGAVKLNNPQSYSFGWSDSSGPNTSQTSNSKNTFKNNPGAAGVVNRSVDTLVAPSSPIAGVTVQFWGPTNKLLATTTTDADGFYQFTYKHTGKEANYTIKLLSPYARSKVVALKANMFKIVNFDDLP